MTISKLAARIAEDVEIMTHADNYSRSLVAEKIQCAIDAAVAEEREACAKVAEEFGGESPVAVVRAIRARGAR